jgi:hypothetical protein
MQTTCSSAELRWTNAPFFVTVSSPNPVVRSDRQGSAAQHAVLATQKASSSFRAFAVPTLQHSRAGQPHGYSYVPRTS